MGVKTFLKSLEQKVASILRAAAKAEPAAAAIADAAAIGMGHPELVPFINRIGAMLTGAGAVVEALNGTSGNGVQKLQLAAPMVDNMLRTSGFLDDKQIIDEAKWNAAVMGITSHFADLYNSVDTKQTQSMP